MSDRATRIGFALRRPWLFLHGLAVRRNQPDLDRLGAITDPERFVWAVLPHAARTFAPSIVALPYRRAIVAAVGYLYARMLDTYEDLEEDVTAQLDGLAAFSARFAQTPPGPAPGLQSPIPRDNRDRVHLLLIERATLVDQVFTGFSRQDRDRVIEMITAMSSGMQRFSQLFDQQGGVLETGGQVEDYCHTVIGHPISFTLRLLAGEQSASRFQEDVLELSVLIQLANVTRDIEKDLGRSVAYHRSLQPHLGGDASSETAIGDVAAARRELVVMALRHVPAYGRLVEDLALPRWSLARGSAVLMALHTDRHYRRMARQSGIEPWDGPQLTVAIWLRGLWAIVSPAATGRLLARLEEHAETAVTARL